MKLGKTEMLLSLRGRGSADFKHWVFSVQQSRFPVRSLLGKDQFVHVVRRSLYLGTMVDDRALLGPELAHRDQASAIAFQELSKALREVPQQDLKAKLLFLDSLSVNSALFSSGAWYRLHSQDLVHLRAQYVKKYKRFLQFLGSKLEARPTFMFSPKLVGLQLIWFYRLQDSGCFVKFYIQRPSTCCAYCRPSTAPHALWVLTTRGCIISSMTLTGFVHITMPWHHYRSHRLIRQRGSNTFGGLQQLGRFRFVGPWTRQCKKVVEISGACAGRGVSCGSYRTMVFHPLAIYLFLLSIGRLFNVHCVLRSRSRRLRRLRHIFERLT